MNRHHLAIIGTAVLYGLIPVFVRLIGSDVPRMTMSFFRLFFGLLFLAALVPFLQKGAARVQHGDLKHFVAIGLIMAASLTVYNIAFLHAPIANVVMLMNSYVIFTAVLAYLFLGETLSRKGMLYLACGLLGIVFMMPLEPSTLVGNLLGLATGVTYAALLTYMRWAERKRTVASVFWFLLFATLALLPFPFVYGLGDWTGSLHWLVLLGVLPTGLAYALLAYGLEKTDADTASALIMITAPVASIAFGWLLFKEAITMNILIGGSILVFAGVLLENEKVCSGKTKRR